MLRFARVLIGALISKISENDTLLSFCCFLQLHENKLKLLMQLQLFLYLWKFCN